MKLVFIPDWFLGSDVLIEIFSLIVLVLFFSIAYRHYKLSKNKNSLYLGIGFFLISLAELATILTKLVLYYDTTFTRQIGQIVVTYQIVKSVDIFYYAGFFFNKLLTLFGLYTIYRINMEKQAKKDMILTVYFLLIISFFSCVFHYYLFHLTALILLVFIMQNYLAIYNKNKSRNTVVLIIAFGVLAISQVVFLFSQVGAFYAVFAELIQLVSYLILLLLIIRIVRATKYDRKKKKQDRHNI